jgi:hypothetical protein
MAACARRSLLAVVLLATILATGCNVLEVPFILFGPEPTNPPEMKSLASPDKKKEVKVVVLAYAGSETRAEFINIDRELAYLVANNLREGFAYAKENVRVIPTKKVEKFKQDHPNWKTMDLASIGKRFDADYVIYIEIDPHSLDLYEKGYGCYRGVADTTITLVDVNDPDEGPMPKEMCFQYPGEGKIAPEVNEIRPVQFRQMFAGYMAKKIAWCFVTHTVKAGYHQEIDAGQGEQTMQLR